MLDGESDEEIEPIVRIYDSTMYLCKFMADRQWAVSVFQAPEDLQEPGQKS